MDFCTYICGNLELIYISNYDKSIRHSKKEGGRADER